MTPTITIPTTALALLTQQGYIQRYHHHLGTGMKSTEAWAAVEAELQQYFKINRYKNIESFRATMTKIHSKK